jgi:HlyD family secretion protein
MPESYADLIVPGKSKSFPFRPGMSANADIQTNTHSKVLAVPINAVTTRDKSDTLAVGKEASASKKDEQKKTEESDTEESAITNVDDLEEVVFVVQKDQTVKRVKVKSAIQDLNNIEIVEGLKEGEEVVVGPYSTVSKLLRNGMKVKVVKKEELFEVKK